MKERQTVVMFKSKFRHQHFGIFEKSLRRSSASTTERQQTDEGNYSASLTKATHEKRGDMDEEKKKSVFRVHAIKRMMDDILQEKLSNQNYDAQTCRILCVELSDEIKSRVKSLEMERFRLICNVSIGSNNGQGFFMASRFLWDEFNDNFSTSCFQNASLFAVAVVFGVLKE